MCIFYGSILKAAVLAGPARRRASQAQYAQSATPTIRNVFRSVLSGILREKLADIHPMTGIRRSDDCCPATLSADHERPVRWWWLSSSVWFWARHSCKGRWQEVLRYRFRHQRVHRHGVHGHIKPGRHVRRPHPSQQHEMGTFAAFFQIRIELHDTNRTPPSLRVEASPSPTLTRLLHAPRQTGRSCVDTIACGTTNSLAGCPVADSTPQP